MTIADQARNHAISLEAKKDALSQRQSGDWKVSFTVQGIDMDPRLTQAPMGTRYAVVLVEIGDDELPASPREVRKPQPVSDKPAGAKRMDWRDMQPAAQSAIRCAEPTFRAFLREVKKFKASHEEDAATAVRDICGVKSRADLGTIHAARVIWHQLDTEYLAWKAVEHA